MPPILHPLHKETTMALLVIAYMGGVLTILSPCILPVLPFVFARAGQPFLKSTLPMLAGMALTFAGVATLAAVGGGWAVEANEIGRSLALVLLAVFGVTLLSPTMAARFTRPIVALGNRLSQAAGTEPRVGGSLVLGVATGLLWAPCAGPILGLVLASAALQGANAGSTALLLAYAAGAATSLALALVIGGQVFAAMKRALGAGEWLRRGLGVAVLVAVAAIGLGLDTGLLARLSGPTTGRIEQALLEFAHSEAEAAPGVTTSNGTVLAAADAPYRSRLPVEGTFPSLQSAGTWLNSAPLTTEQLRGKVVLIDFWTYSCINCIRTLPYIRAWTDKYKDQGLVVIGVHTPEFAFEKKLDNVKTALGTLKIDFPVVTDNDYKIWRAFGNNYWPALYFIDAEGKIRHHQFGEGNYDRSEKVIQDLLKDAGSRKAEDEVVAPAATGAEAPADLGALGSPETYLGYEQARRFASPEGMKAGARDYTAGAPRLNQWSLAGNWTVGGQQASLNQPGGSITYRFRARDLHLVLGPGASGREVPFEVRIDGQPPGADHGADIDAEGRGTVKETRLYQLVRQAGNVEERTFEVRFLAPGVEAFAFTFG
jgi:cytochrome c biogenesis protein CcdA/thiol-disulfide isomerase/thioredoxin